jgi:hypothetical protein
MDEMPADGRDGQPEPPRVAGPQHSADAALRVAQLTGMTPEAAEVFAAFHSGLRSWGPARRRPA